MSYERQKRMIDGLRARGGERHVLMLQPEQQRGLEAYVAAMGGTITDALNALVAAGLAAEGVKPAPKLIAPPKPVGPAALEPGYTGPRAIVREQGAEWGPFKRKAPLPDHTATWPAFVKAFKAAESDFERREVARMAVSRSMTMNRTVLQKTKCEALNAAMLERVAATQVRRFLAQVATEHGEGEAVEASVNAYLDLIDVNSVFGHLHNNDAALGEFRKFLKL